MQPYGRGHLAKALREARAHLDVSQYSVAHHIGVHLTSYGQAELGRKLLRDDRLLLAEQFLECPAGTLVRAAAQDRQEVKLPVGQEDRDDVVVMLAVRWRDLSRAQIDGIREVLRAAG